MRVFVTGASGWIGSVVVEELIGAGHHVVGLARSDASADALTAAGVEVLRGSLEDVDALERGAGDSDGVIHLAFQHDVAFSGGFLAAAQVDRHAVDVFAHALAGSDRPLVIASGTLGVSPGRVATESDGHFDDPSRGVHGEGPLTRWSTAEFTLSLAERSVRSCVMRLPPTNHGEGDNGFMATLVAIARATGVSGYVGDGTNRWPAVHRRDSARLFRRALESAPAGTTLHAVAEEGVAIRDVAEVIGRHLGVPVTSVTPGGAAQHFTWLAGFIGLDSPASSAWTREVMHWQPTQSRLLEDLDEGHYFR